MRYCGAAWNDPVGHIPPAADLKQARLVKYRREGKVVYYSLDDEHVSNIFAQGFAHVSHR